MFLLFSTKNQGLKIKKDRFLRHFDMKTIFFFSKTYETKNMYNRYLTVDIFYIFLITSYDN